MRAAGFAIVAVYGAACGAACGLVACAGPQRPAVSTDELVALRDGWLRAFNAKQLEPVIASYTIDAVVLPITGGRIVSAAAIKTLYERMYARLTPHIELTSHMVERSGDLAYDSGDYVENLSADGNSVNLAGAYVFVYRREPQGWRIVEQIWTEASGGPGDAPDRGPRAP